MIMDNSLDNSVISPPIGLHEALNLFILHQIHGYAPFMFEQDDGTYIVHRGEQVMVA